MDILNGWLPLIIGWIGFANGFVKEWWGIIFVAMFIWVSGELNWIREFMRRTSIRQNDLISELAKIKFELSNLRKKVAPTDEETLKKFNLFD